MSGIIRVWAVALSDFRERSRRYSFWIFLVLMAYAAFLFLPTAQAGYSCIVLDGNRGIYNSAWVGVQVALMTVSILALVGFYFVRGGVSRDAQFKTTEIIAATPVRNLEYLTGKALSNILVLASMTVVLAVMAAVMQLVRGESSMIAPTDLLAPFVVIILPLMILVAATAALFDAIHWLRGGIGNVAFFVAWAVAIGNFGIRERALSPLFDLFGVNYLWLQMMQACAAAVPGYVPWQGRTSLGFNINATGELAVRPTFVWDGASWSGEFLLGRLLIVLFAAVVVVLGARAFHRFESPVSSRWRRVKRKKPEDLESTRKDSVGSASLPRATLTPLETDAFSFRFASLAKAELRLLLARVSRWWYLVAAGLILAGLLTPYEIAYKFLLPAAWFWPLLIWSQMGCRERLHGTEPIVLATPRFFTRQFFAQAAAGIFLTLAVGSFVGVRTLIAADWPALAHWFNAAMFIPAFAILCGSLTGGRKLFEVLYTLLWYMGPLNKLPLLDFTGSAGFNSAGRHLAVWIAVTLLVGLFAFLARWRQARAR